MPETIIEVGDERWIEIKNTEMCDILHIKILSKYKYWHNVCYHIEHMVME